MFWLKYDFDLPDPDLDCFAFNRQQNMTKISIMCITLELHAFQILNNKKPKSQAGIHVPTTYTQQGN